MATEEDPLAAKSPPAHPTLFSYSRAHCEAARALAGPRTRPAPFIDSPLPEPPDEFIAPTLDQLTAFFKNPAQFLLGRVLHIRLTEEDPAPDESENFTFSGLDRYGIEDRMLKTGFAGGDAADLADLTRAEGILPHGVPGRCAFDRSARAVRSFVEKAEPLAGPLLAEFIEIAPEAGGIVLPGRIGPVHEGGLFFARHGTLRAFDQLRAWIAHLALCAAAPAGVPRKTLILGLNRREWSAFQLGEVAPERSVECLSTLVSVYREGLTRPIPFFPKSSFAYAKALRAEKPSAQALEAAAREWEGNEFNHIEGEGEDPWIDLCFRVRSPFDGEEGGDPEATETLLADFDRLARAVFLPLLEHTGALP